MASAVEVLQDALESAGIGELADLVWGLHQQNYDYDYIYNEIVKSETYKQRFSGLVTLREQGQAGGMSEAQYLQLESQMRNDLRRAGFGGTDFDSQEYIATVIGNRVSEDEFSDRILMAQRAATTLPADVRREMQERYGVSSQNILGYYMDTERTEQQLLREQQTSQLAAVYERFQSTPVSTGALESVVSQFAPGTDMLQQGSDAIRSLGTLGGGLTDQQRLEGLFGMNRFISRQRAARAAQFSGGGNAAGDTEGVSGLGTAATT